MKWIVALLWLTVLPASAQAVVSGSNGRIAYRCNGVDGICTANPDGSAARTVTAHGENPAWSPDGQTIAFDTINGAVLLVSPDGSAQRTLTQGREPAWSPDGTRLAYAGLGGLRVIGADGAGDHALGVDSATDAPGAPDWSPDGTHIAFHRQSLNVTCSGDACSSFAQVGDVWIANADGSGAQVVASDGSDPAFSPDGTRIAYTRQDCALSCYPGPGRIYIAPVAGGMAVDTGLDGFQPRWAPDGTSLLYTGSQGLMTATPDGTTKTAICAGSDGDWQSLAAPSGALDAGPQCVSVATLTATPTPETPLFTTSIRNAPWALTGVSKDGRTLQIVYQGGGCLHDDGRAVADETAKRIRIAVRQTMDVPVGPYAACTTELRFLRTTAHLRRPIAGRPVRGGPAFDRSTHETKMPRLIGLRRADAVRIADRLGPNATFTRRRGVVTDQRPRPGRKLARQIKLTISRS